MRDQTGAQISPRPKDSWDPTHTSDADCWHWTTTNIGEAVPGVVSPLCTDLWGVHGEPTALETAYKVGVVSKRELKRTLAPEDRALRFFYGRLAVKLEYLVMLGDRMPGVTGPELIESLFNQAPAGLQFHPMRRRYPFVAVRMPYTFITSPSRLRAMCADTDRWWRTMVDDMPGLDHAAALAALTEAMGRFRLALGTHITAMFGSFQPVFDLLDQLITTAGTGDLAVLSGTGGAEMAVVGDIWKASRGQIEVADIVRNHGFHGPDEGEVSSRVWRDDDAPLRRVIEHYRAVPDEQDPARTERAKEQRRIEMTRAVLAALPVTRRPAASFILKLARERIPDRGRGKRAFLQAIDVCRMAARRAGELSVADGRLNDPDDTFYLTERELRRPLPRDVNDLIRWRRERREHDRQIALADITWGGLPITVAPTGHRGVRETDGSTTVLRGVGASGGIVTGVVRVVTDPTFAEVEPDEVLVATTTDPSWCSIMFVSAALVVDLGGMLSHAAVVARELGIPCVVNAQTATTLLRTGDRVRVDGAAGTVEILTRAPLTTGST